MFVISFGSTEFFKKKLLLVHVIWMIGWTAFYCTVSSVVFSNVFVTDDAVEFKCEK